MTFLPDSPLAGWQAIAQTGDEVLPPTAYRALFHQFSLLMLLERLAKRHTKAWQIRKDDALRSQYWAAVARFCTESLHPLPGMNRKETVQFVLTTLKSRSVTGVSRSFHSKPNGRFSFVVALDGRQVFQFSAFRNQPALHLNLLASASLSLKRPQLSASDFRLSA